MKIIYSFITTFFYLPILILFYIITYNTIKYWNVQEEGIIINYEHKISESSDYGGGKWYIIYTIATKKYKYKAKETESKEKNYKIGDNVLITPRGFNVFNISLSRGITTKNRICKILYVNNKKVNDKFGLPEFIYIFFIILFLLIISLVIKSKLIKKHNKKGNIISKEYENGYTFYIVKSENNYYNIKTKKQDYVIEQLVKIQLLNNNYAKILK